MSQTIRVRDDDAELIETICHVTGLDRPEAAHFLIRTGAGEDGRVRNVAERGLERYITRLYPELDSDAEIDETMRDKASLRSAEQLMAVSPDVTRPES